MFGPNHFSQIYYKSDIWAKDIWAKDIWANLKKILALQFLQKSNEFSWLKLILAKCHRFGPKVFGPYVKQPEILEWNNCEALPSSHIMNETNQKRPPCAKKKI